MDFTPEQLEAIGHRGSNLQLIACAGSGKTEVVARRIASILDPSNKPRVNPNNIVAFTFTEKAAAELKERIQRRCRESFGQLHGLADMYVGTIHGFCLEVLKSEVPHYLKFEVLNEVQQRLFVDRHSATSGLTTSTDLAGVPLRRYLDTNLYSNALSILRESECVDDVMQNCSVRHGLDEYVALLDSRRYLDYSGIMSKAVEAIANDTGVQSRISARLRYVVVDEYQDVNPLQERLIHLLHGLGAELCVVGDDDQTVYQWRGSDVRAILTFADRYPNVHQIRLQDNFRSSAGIIDTAQAFIAQNVDRLPKAMKPTAAQADDVGDVTALNFLNPSEEAEYIAQTIQHLRGTSFVEEGKARGLAWSDIAVLLRSVKQSGAAITDALTTHGVPFVIVGMNDLFSTPEAEAARQLFYFMASQAGVTVESVYKAWLDAKTGADANALQQAITQAGVTRTSLGDPDQRRWNFYNLQRTFLTFLETAGIREEKVPDNREEVVLYNLGKFSQAISDFESIHFHSKPQEKYLTFAKFLQYGAENSYPEGWQDNAYANPDAVRIMTVHQAKGMEWPVVFIPSLVRNRFPTRKPGGKSIWHLLPAAGVKGAARFNGNIEDERRLFYVAMTRSKKFLHMTWAPIPRNRQAQRASEFWDNVLSSRWVKRRQPDYSARARLVPSPRAGIADVVLTFSDLKYFFECPYQFKLRVLYGFNPPIHEALGYGKSLHDALADVHARALRGEVLEPDAAGALIATHLHTPYAYPALREQLRTSAELVVRDYLTDNADLLRKTEFAEKTIEIHLGDGISVTGRIDLVRRLDNNETTIIDLKSTNRAQAEAVTELQLHIYALGYEELTGRRADFVEIYNLDERKGKPRSVDDDFIADVRVAVAGAASALRSNTLLPAPAKPKCAACDYCRMCSVGAAAVAVV